MSVRNSAGLLIIESASGPVLPTADEIYSVVKEGFTQVQGVQVAADAFHETGLVFSSEPAAPTLVLSAEVEIGGEPKIVCQLAGAAESQIEPASTAPGFQADYVIIGQTWFPLPLGTANDFTNMLAACRAKDASHLNLGEYLEVLKRGTAFRIDDRAAPQLAAGTLAARIGTAVPLGLAGTPYPYQLVGLQWLGFMARHGVGAIIADEMGLGKTLQVIAVLLTETIAGRRPSLVICPATILENWRRELLRFAPALSVRVHAGPRRTGRIGELGETDVTICSYETMVGDISLFRAINWNVVALDEAQNIKNPAARRTLRSKEIPKRAAIAITGTPVENRLQDLWSITDFILPGYLGTLGDFEAAHPDTLAGARDLEPLVSALMLRRRVRDVAQDLPARIDVPVPLVMDVDSAAAYEDIRKEVALQHPQNPDLPALIKLRLFCAHPWAAGKLKNGGDPVRCSPKLQRCLEILEEIVASGEKALVFTSFNEAADIIADKIAEVFEVPVGKINGSVSVRERQPIVDEFSAVKGAAILVLNPKAAGTGLNIAAANHVIHYNLEWNPAVEDQASARAHRRGQALPVTIHRMFYTDTVEEVIDERMARKRSIAGQAVVGTTGAAEDLTDIVRALQRTPKRAN